MLDNFPLSNKQVKTFNDSTARINIWAGAVRSGKTFVSILKLLDRMRNGVPGDVMIIGVSRATIQRNVLSDLYRLMGFAPPSSKTMESELYERNVYFVGANNEGAVRSIQGSTLAYAYVDEATQIPKAFWNMLLARLSVDGAQLFSTCNPEGPTHWLKKDFIDRKDDLDLKDWQFHLRDNPALTETYKSGLKAEYQKDSLLYKRLILGEWALAQGLIFDGFDETNLYDELEPNPAYRICSIDYGTHNPTAALIIGIYPKQWPQIRVMDEYYFDSRKEGRAKTDAELADDIESFLKYKAVRDIYVDPSSASFKQELRGRDLCVSDARNEVLSGIRVTAKFISQKNIVIHKEKCPNLLESIYSYVWDERSSNKGEDKPVKENDHMVDALRYGIFSAFSTGEVSSHYENSIEEIRKLVYGEEPSLLM